MSEKEIKVDKGFRQKALRRIHATLDMSIKCQARARLAGNQTVDRRVKLRPDGKNKASDSNEDVQKAGTTKQLSKPKIIIAGDSMLKNLDGWMMARSKSVKIHSFPGATTEDIASYLTPLINKRPDHILSHIGTNNLVTDSPQEIAENILALTQMITDKGIGCSVSEIIRRDDYLWLVGLEVHCIPKNMFPAQIKLVCNDSIGTSTHHLNSSGLHSKRRGESGLAHNFIQFIKKLDFNPVWAIFKTLRYGGAIMPPPPCNFGVS